MPAAETTPGHLFVIAAPSGAGKTTLVHKLTDADPNLRFSISYTTRAPRKNEVDGTDYNFITPDVFATMSKAGDFLEHALVFDNHYGTSKSHVEGQLNAGHNVILEIDWQGAEQVRSHMPDCRSVFIMPPSLDELEQRLTGRGTDSAEVVARRFRDAVSDMSHWSEFDYVVVNDDLDEAHAELAAILAGNGDDNATTNPALRTRVDAILQQK